MVIKLSDLSKKKVYYDYKTKNKSFLKIAKILKNEGIRNYKFHLAVYDKDLIGIDPYAEDLTLLQQSKILKEATINVWYFLREVLRVPVPGGNVRFDLHRGNLAMIFCLTLNIDTSIELPRQHYKTYSAVSYYLWLMLYAAKNYTAIFSHKSYKDTVANLKRLTDMLEPQNKCLPGFMLAPLGNDDIRNQELLTIKSSNNSVRTVGPANNEEAADKSG